MIADLSSAVARNLQATSATSACYNLAAPYQANNVQHYYIDPVETILYNGAFDGYLNLGGPYWDALNADNDCQYPAFDIQCDNEQVGEDVFWLYRWGRFSIRPSRVDLEDGQKLVETTCTMSVYFEDYDPSLVDEANYFTVGSFSLTIGYE